MIRVHRAGAWSYISLALPSGTLGFLKLLLPEEQGSNPSGHHKPEATNRGEKNSPWNFHPAGPGAV